MAWFKFLFFAAIQNCNACGKCPHGIIRSTAEGFYSLIYSWILLYLYQECAQQRLSGMCTMNALRLFHFVKVHVLLCVNEFCPSMKVYHKCLTASAIIIFVVSWFRIICASMAFSHFSHHGVPHILRCWEEQQNSRPKLTLFGDCRSDSPGHYAKYGTYSLMHAVSGKVLALELVQVSNLHNWQRKNRDIEDNSRR